MMGPSHAISGAAAFAVGCRVADAAGYHPSCALVFVGMGVTAGQAMMNDMDCPSSTVARCTSTTASRLIAKLSREVHEATATSWDRLPDRDGDGERDGRGHRTLTHTIPWAIGAGLATAAFTAWAGPALTMVERMLFGLLHQLGVPVAATPPPWLTGWTFTHGGQLVAAWVLYVSLTVAHRAIWGRSRRAQAAIVGLVAAAWWWFMPAGGWSWLGFAVTGGYIIHILGDTITESGTPMGWPLKIKRQRWYAVTLPDWLSFTTNSWQERWVVKPVMVMVGAGALWQLDAVQDVVAAAQRLWG